MKKGKKSDIKDKRQNKHTLARFSNMWLENGKKPPISLLVQQESKAGFTLKECAKVMADSMHELYGTEKHELDVSTDPPKKKLSKAERKAIKKAKRKKAEVIPIGSKPRGGGFVNGKKTVNKGLGKTGRNVHKDRPVVKPEPDELAVDIAMLENIIEVDKHNEQVDREAASTTKASNVVPITEKGEANRKATHSGYGFAANKTSAPAANDNPDWHLEYGTKYKPIGKGYTPSGRPIADFLEGGPFAPPKKESELHSVTETANEDYTYEELAEQNDRLKLLLHSQKADYERRLDAKDNMISSMEKTLLELRQAERVEQFHDAHVMNYEAAVIELQEELSFAQREVEEQRTEINLLMDQNEKLARALDGELPSVEYASKNSKPPLKTLANQFNIFKSQWNDDPLKAYLRLSPYDSLMTKDLRRYFDVECDTRLIVSKERAVYRRWSKRGVPHLRWSVRTRVARKVTVPNETAALNRIGERRRALNATKVDWLDRQLRKDVGCDVGANKLHNFWHKPTLKHNEDDYAKLWLSFKSITPREEYEEGLYQAERKERAEYLASTGTGKVVTKVVKSFRAINELLNYELDSKKREESENKKALAERKATEKASAIKRKREEDFEKQFELERIREAQRIAH